MKKVQLTLLIKVRDPEIEENDVIQKWLENSVDGLIHESYNDDDTKLGELDVKVTGLEINDE